MPRHITKLTPREEKFCLSYLVDFNATRAASEAGYVGKQMNVVGWKLLQRPRIQKRIHKLREEMEGGFNVTRERIAQELSKLALLDPKGFLDANGAVKSIHDMGDERLSITGFEVEKEPDRWEFDEFGEMVLVPGKKSVMTKVKVSEKRAALEALNKMMGYNAADKLAFTDPKGKGVIPVINLNIVHPKEEDE